MALSVRQSFEIIKHHFFSETPDHGNRTLNELNAGLLFWKVLFKRSGLYLPVLGDAVQRFKQ